MARFFHCPSCKERLWKVRDDIQPWSMFTSQAYLECRPDVPAPQVRDETKCPLCGYFFNNLDFQIDRLVVERSDPP